MTDLARVAELEASGRAALPALEERRVGGWALRVSGGDTKRVNSASPTIANARPGEVMEEAKALYAANALPCRFRLTPLAHEDADALLEGAGFSPAEPSVTMVARLGARPADAAVVMRGRADAAWLARAEPLSGRSAAATAVQARLLAAMPGPIVLATIEEEGLVVAAGYASVGGDRAQLSDIVVTPHARGRGLGRRLVSGLLRWAHARERREAMLQVRADNDVARGLYRSLGFADAYPYHYRVR